MRIQTVYVFEMVNEGRQIEVATQKAREHPDKLANVCYHRQNESCNKKCYTLDLSGEEEYGVSNN